MTIGISRFGAYLPKYRLDRKLIADAWGFPPTGGTIAVNNIDEDAITMAIEAGFDCLGDLDPTTIDGLYFASTTGVYKEKQNAALIATVLDLRPTIDIMDVSGSTRSSTEALARAYEAVKSGCAKSILVIGADTRAPMPESMDEYQYGDGAAAVLISSQNVAASIEGHVAVASNVTGPWKRASDSFIRSFDGKHEIKYGFTQNTFQAFNALFKELHVDPASIVKAAFYAPHPSVANAVGKQLKLSPSAIQDSLYNRVGNTGNALALMLLILAFDQRVDGDQIALGGYGDGADAFLLKVQDAKGLNQLIKTCRGVSVYDKSIEPLRNYTTYLAYKKKLDRDRFTRKSSPIRQWREEKFLMRFYGMKCTNCGTVQYPIWRACIECGTKDQHEDVKLQKRGAIFSFTLDHIQGGEYYNIPFPRCVIDLDGGGRVLCDMTDITDPSKIRIGMRVELTYRKVHEGGEFHNYYWKCRPLRDVDATKGGEK